MKRRITRTISLLSSLIGSAWAGYYSSNYNNDEKFEQQQQLLSLEVCEDSVVAVKYLSVVCDSPYTFYYGNGANRNSYVCDYGDKASLSITFQVLDDLQESDTEIFMTMAAYDDVGNLLTSTNPEYLCRDYVGYDCTKQGTYNVDKKLKFGNPSSDRTKFYPKLSIAFSTKPDHGYNLGAVNMICEQWDKNEPASVSWSDETPNSKLKEIMYDYGLVLITGLALSIFSFFVWWRSLYSQGIDFQREGIGEAPSLMEL